MSANPQPDTSTDLIAQPYAVRLGSALLVALALILILTWRDNARRSTLETVIQSSAVGDTNYFRLPEPLPEPPFPIVVILGGKPLYPVSYKRHEKREADLVRVAVDKPTGLAIYQAPLKAKDEAVEDREPNYFIKVGPGEFLKLRLPNEGR